MRRRSRIRSNAISTLGTKISQGITGLMQVQTFIGTSAGTAAGVDGASGTVVGGSPSPGVTTGGTLSAGYLTQFSDANGLGMGVQIALTNGSDTLNTGDVSYSTHVTNVINQVSTMGDLIVNPRNEGQGSYTAAQVTAEIVAASPIVKGIVPTARIIGPCELSMAGTTGRTSRVASFISQGLFSAVDAFAFHCYDGPNNSVNYPESKYVREICYLINRAYGVNPTLPVMMSETAWQQGNPAGDEYAAEVTKANYMARMILLCRGLRNMTSCGIFSWRDGAVQTGISNNNNPYWSFRHACEEIALWNTASSYTRQGFAVTDHRSGAWPSSDDLYGGDLDAAPWFVRGTQSSDGAHRLAMWHATSSSYADNIVVDSLSNGTLTMTTDFQAIGAPTTTTVSLTQRRQTVPVTLGAMPIVAYSGDAHITFPEFSH